jgi:hypothetical protein
METVWIGVVVILIFFFTLSRQKLRERQTGRLQTRSEKKQVLGGSADRPHQDEDGKLERLAIAHKKALVSLNTAELIAGITRDLGGNSRNS